MRFGGNCCLQVFFLFSENAHHMGSLGSSDDTLSRLLTPHSSSLPILSNSPRVYVVTFHGNTLYSSGGEYYPVIYFQGNGTPYFYNLEYYIRSCCTVRLRIDLYFSLPVCHTNSHGSNNSNCKNAH